MAKIHSWILRVLITAGVGFALLSAPRAAHAGESARRTTGWCGPDSEALPNEVCYLDGRANGQRRTLVIWLHGVIAKNTTWSWSHQHMLRRIAKQHGIEMLFPRGTPGQTLYGWPGTLEAQEKSEQQLIDEWMSAKTMLEARDGRAFDEVFVFGFSSGAYFASSLAMRGRVGIDGYAVLCGGQPMAPQAKAVEHFAPVFVGVCADDKTTAAHSRAFAGSVASAGISRMVSVQRVGHDLSEIHFAQALTYLRGTMKAPIARREAREAPST
jgi:predicted esterase